MIRVRFCWRRLLAPICTLLLGHEPYVEHLGVLVETRSLSGNQLSGIRLAHVDDDFFYCPRCYAGWPKPHAVEWT